MNPDSVLGFWFVELRPAQWWRQDAALDRIVAQRFGGLHGRAIHGELFAWRKEARGRLAEILVLDQFSRHIHRDTALAFAADPMALALAQEALAAGAAAQLAPALRAFLYMPFMHSESAVIHDIALALFSEAGLEASLESEREHKAIIDRFGRYPHRNRALGRASTAEEREFLREQGLPD